MAKAETTQAPKAVLNNANCCICVRNRSAYICRSCISEGTLAGFCLQHANVHQKERMHEPDFFANLAIKKALHHRTKKFTCTTCKQVFDMPTGTMPMPCPNDSCTGIIHPPDRKVQMNIFGDRAVVMEIYAYVEKNYSEKIDAFGRSEY